MKSFPPRTEGPAAAFRSPVRLIGENVSEASLREFSGRLGVDAAARDSEAPVVVLVGDADDGRLAAAVAHRFAACVEIVGDGGGGDYGTIGTIGKALTGEGLLLSLTTRAAYRSNVARHFCRRLIDRLGLPMAQASDIEVACHEAVLRAILRSNLEIFQHLPETRHELQAFSRRVAEALADPYAGLARLTVTADWSDRGLMISIAGRGEGFAPTAADRGMDVIRSLVRAMSFDDGGRRLVLEFPR